MDDYLGAALTAMLVGLFGKLRARGVLSQDDLMELFENATLGLEEMGLQQSETARQAHNFLTTLQAAVRGDPEPPKPIERA
jgi:hypothetical protein